MNHFVEDIMAGFNSLFSFNHYGLLEKISFNKLLFWLVIYSMIILVVYRILRNRPLSFAAVNLFILLCCVVAGSLWFTGNREMLLAAEMMMGLLTFLYLYLLFLWIPIRLQYDPQAEEKIRQLTVKAVLNDEEIKRLYHLKASTKAAYDNNVKWLLRIDHNKNKEI